jgi:hypothetical protein
MLDNKKSIIVFSNTDATNLYENVRAIVFNKYWPKITIPNLKNSITNLWNSPKTVNSNPIFVIKISLTITVEI